ncbi:Mu transposase domain-containing protein, partial [Sphingobacterium cavernae]|uniref:Mu transposase domain-containing protein n=1 Tax=Sphingobacterium cavernae TaxID=2592657 RepID=UPI001CB82F5E
MASEKAALQSLPKSRFQIMHVEHRKVNRMGHLSFRQNYYSVPARYMSQYVRIESNGTILKVYDGVKQIALHQISSDIGMFISLEAHRPDDKKSVSKKEYRNMMTGVGSCAEAFFDGLVQEVPSHWRKMTQGILSLKKRFTNEQLDIACARALYFHAFSYQHIKGICEKGLFELPKENGATL